MKNPKKILVVEDSPDHLELSILTLQRYFPQAVIKGVETGDNCLKELEKDTFSIVILDYFLPDMDGLAVLKKIKQKNYKIPVIFVTGRGDEQIAVQAMKDGAYDYVVKSFDYLEDIPNIIEKAYEKHCLNSKLEETEKRYRQIFENASDAIITVNLEEKITSANKAACQMFNIPELAGLVIKDLISPASYQNYQQIQQTILNGENNNHSFDIECRKLFSSETFIGSLSISLIENAIALKEVQLFIRDITDKINFQKLMIKNSKELSILNNIYRTINEALTIKETLNKILEILLNLFSVKTGVIYLNEGNEYRLKVSAGILDEEAVKKAEVFSADDVLINDPQPKIYHSEEENRETYLFNEIARSEKIKISFVLPLSSKKGITAIIILGSCDSSSFQKEELKIIENIKSQLVIAIENAYLYSQKEELASLLEEKVKERTRQLELANLRLRKLSKQKTEFFSRISHELRTSMNSIIGFNGIILQGLSGPLTKTQEKQLSIAYDSAKHMLMLINESLNIVKMEAGKMEIFMEELDLEELVTKVIETFSPLAIEKELQLKSRVNKEKIYADKEKLEEIMTNLLSNAVKFTEKGIITITANVKDMWLNIMVEDTGIGIRQEDIANLFEEFYQIRTPLHQFYKGSGLGLAITKKLVNLLKGEIWAESVFGKGTAFFVKLPLAPEE